MTEVQKKILEKVKKICGTTDNLSNHMDLGDFGPEVNDIPTKDTFEIAHEILNLVGVDNGAEIFEIPLCWDDQVGIRFNFPHYKDLWSNSFKAGFTLYAGISKSDENEFFLELAIDTEYGEDNQILLLSEVWKIRGDE